MHTDFCYLIFTVAVPPALLYPKVHPPLIGEANSCLLCSMPHAQDVKTQLDDLALVKSPYSLAKLHVLGAIAPTTP